MGFIVQSIVVAFILMIIGIVKIFYKFTERKENNGVGVALTSLALVIVYIVSFSIYGMTFDPIGFQCYSNTPLAYMIFGAIVLIKLCLIFSIIHQTMILKPKRKIKIEKL